MAKTNAFSICSWTPATTAAAAAIAPMPHPLLLVPQPSSNSIHCRRHHRRPLLCRPCAWRCRRNSESLLLRSTASRRRRPQHWLQQDRLRARLPLSCPAPITLRSVWPPSAIRCVMSPLSRIKLAPRSCCSGCVSKTIRCCICATISATSCWACRRARRRCVSSWKVLRQPVQLAVIPAVQHPHALAPQYQRRWRPMWLAAPPAQPVPIQMFKQRFCCFCLLHAAHITHIYLEEQTNFFQHAAYYYVSLI